ncbi:MAG TPA: putative metal-binding motif-containing protein [Sandaracinaceae bacterium]
MDALRSRRLVLLVGAFAILAMGSDFRGCGSESPPPDDVPLPASDGGCLFDSDCGVDECSVVACVEGECVPVAPRTDADGDGFPPPPCGTDCRDSNATVFPGSAERCDGVDQDCDGTIDEGAPGLSTQVLRDGLIDATLVGLDDGFAVLGRDTDGQLAGYVVGSDGTAGPTRALFGPDADGVVLVAAAGDGSRTVAAFALEGGQALRADVARDAGGLSLAGPPEALPTSGHVLALAAHVFRGEAFIALELADGADRRRVLWSERTGALVPLSTGDVGPYLADDGTHVVVTDGDDRLDFFDADLALAGSRTLPGPLATGRGIAPASGAVVAAYRDAFDHNLANVDLEGIRSPIAAPFGMRDEVLGLHAVAEGILVTRFGGAEPRAWILGADLRTYLGSFTGEDLGGLPPDRLTRMSAATDTGGTSAILASHSNGESALALLRCTTAP